MLQNFFKKCVLTLESAVEGAPRYPSLVYEAVESDGVITMLPKKVATLIKKSLFSVGCGAPTFPRRQ